MLDNKSQVSSLLDSIVDILQHVLVKVFVSIHSLQIFLELLFREKQCSWLGNNQPLFPGRNFIQTPHMLLGDTSSQSCQHGSLAQIPKSLAFSASLTEHPTNN